jgi:hypothetical protein
VPARRAARRRSSRERAAVADGDGVGGASTTLALDSIKAFEIQLTRKSHEAEELRRAIQSQVCVVTRCRVSSRHVTARHVTSSRTRVLPPWRCGCAVAAPSGGAWCGGASQAKELHELRMRLCNLRGEGPVVPNRGCCRDMMSGDASDGVWS